MRGEVHKSVWEELNWFVRLAKTDLDASQGDLLMLREDLAAMRKVYLGLANSDDKDNQPTDEEIADFQREIKRHLEELANQGYTVLPETEVQQLIVYPHVMEKLAMQEGWKPYPQPVSVPDSNSVFYFPKSVTGLIAVMGRLLGKVGTRIVRCPHCKNIFLQSRRDQEYCGRSCQSVACVQRRRAEAMAVLTWEKARASKKATANKLKG